MVRQVKIITQSHIPPSDDMEDGTKGGYTYPPYTFQLEQYNGRMSIECYKNGKWSHTVAKPDEDGIAVEMKFTQIIEAYVQMAIDSADPEPATLKEKVKQFFKYYLTRDKIRDTLGM